MKFKGKIKDYNYEKEEVVIKLSFITDEVLGFLEKGKELDKFLNFDSSIPRGQEGSYEQQKKIWVMAKDILLFLNKKNKNLLINQENLRAVYETSIRQLFPARTIEIDGTVSTYLPSLSDLTMEERAFVIEQIEEKYSPMGVDFDDYEKRI
jgi:hypothetical protein